MAVDVAQSKKQHMSEEEELALDSRHLDDQYHERYGSVGDQSPDWSERVLRHIARELRWLRERSVARS